MPRWWLPAGLALLVGLVGLGVLVAWPDGERPCGSAVRSYAAADSRSPFVDPAVPADERLVDALTEQGEVVGGYGYDYEPPQLSGTSEGLAARVRDDNRSTLLDADLAPRWSVAVGTRSSTFDTGADSYVVVTLPEDAAPEVVSLDLATGERRWCTSLGGDPVTDQPVSTRVLDDGSVLALVGGEEQRLLRAGPDGDLSEVAPEAGSGDALDLGPDGLVVVGGSALTDLLDPAALADRDDEVLLAGHDVDDGEERWVVPGAPGRGLHLAGVAASGTVVTVEAADGEEQPALVGRSPGDGEEVWRAEPSRGTAFDTTVRGDRVVVRAGGDWSAYDAATGRRLWRFSVPAEPQQLPYGATLDAMPGLDADTLLVGGTRSLETLDLRDGTRTDVPLPTDGVATTYWPVAVAASPGLVGVVTNVATVVVRR